MFGCLLLGPVVVDGLELFVDKKAPWLAIYQISLGTIWLAFSSRCTFSVKKNIYSTSKAAWFAFISF